MTATRIDGAKKTLDVRIPVACEQCGGSGCAPGTHPERCATCGGSGEVRQVRRSLIGQLVTAGPCPQCAATGTIIPSPCDVCRGEGRVAGNRQLEIDVYPDTDGGRFANRPAASIVGLPTESGEPALDEPGFKVLHLVDADFRSTCLTFVACLDEVEAWSSDNPSHLPVMIMVEAKGDSLASQAKLANVDLSGLPALPAIALGFLVPNADLLWREVRAAREPAPT